MNQQLKPKEYDILQVLMQSDKPMTASEIVKTDDHLTVNTVQAILRRLSGMKLVEVADIVYSGNVLSRAFRPTADASEIIKQMFEEDVRQFQKIISKQSLLSAMLQAGSDKESVRKDIEALEDVLKNFKSRQ